MDADAYLFKRASRSCTERPTLSYDPEGTRHAVTYSWNRRQRAAFEKLNFTGSENAKLAATISFKKREYLPTIHMDLRDHLMKLMVYIITTKGYEITSEDNDEHKYTKLTAKIDIRELNLILKPTLRGVVTFDNDEVNEGFAEVTLNVWGVLGFQRVLEYTAKRLNADGDSHDYWKLMVPERLTTEMTLLRGQLYHLSGSSTSV